MKMDVAYAIPDNKADLSNGLGLCITRETVIHSRETEWTMKKDRSGTESKKRASVSCFAHLPHEWIVISLSLGREGKETQERRTIPEQRAKTTRGWAFKSRSRNGKTAKAIRKKKGRMHWD